MEITSPVFRGGEAIPLGFTCDGADTNPPLAFHGVPDEARSFVLIMDDPDAPGGTWTHWTLWNIPPAIKEIAEDSVPLGASEGMTDSGRSGWSGPCPPDREHRYFFRLFALDVSLDLRPGTPVKALRSAMEGHVLAEASLMGRYERVV